MKQIQIPEKLFLDLIRYHIFGLEDLSPEINAGLKSKLDAMTRRELYTEYKEAETEEERETARKKYLEMRGISKNFQW